MKRSKPIATFLLASVAMLVLAGCPHRHRNHYPSPPPSGHHDGDHHDNDHQDHDSPH